MDEKRYYFTTFIFAFFNSPIVFSFCFGQIPLMLVTGPLLILLWYYRTKDITLPQQASKILFPVLSVFCYYMIVWFFSFRLNNIYFNDSLLTFYNIFTFPYFILNIVFSVNYNYDLLPIVNSVVTSIIVLTIVITSIVNNKKIKFDPRVYALFFISLCLFGITYFIKPQPGFYEQNSLLSRDNSIDLIEDEVNLYDYQPFKEKNQLKRLNKPPTITFNENYPKLDGATAAYPVYGAIVQELYKGLDIDSVEQYVNCSTTDVAYDRLINGEIDIFFGAQPSKQQVEAAKENGIELVKTPIGKEAFVFFVNKYNPVESLTISQIQDIYQKTITNWTEVGGRNEKIMPFQRPENSGSQTIMIAKVMGDKPLPEPLSEEYHSGMGGVMSSVATYRNYSSSIGYSFRFYATGMNSKENIRLLAIDGIKPTVENIRNGTYPFIIDVYAVTASAGSGSDSANENADKLIQWILSDQGQEFIETCGYVRN